MEPTELINPDAQHCAGSEVTHLKDKSVLKDDVNHEPEAVKCWTTAPNRSRTFPLWF